MPLISDSTYSPPFGFSNGHLQTILPTLFRRVDDVAYERERITTEDQDFLDLDWIRGNSQRLVIISHGLEGNSRRSYVLGMARAFHLAEWDVLAWNYRGCSGEPNRNLRSYHSGETGDLRSLVQLAFSRGYDRVVLVGFSLGGNVTLKYCGEEGDSIDPRVTHAVTFSVPCDLASSADRLALRRNAIYMRRFVQTLVAKIREKGGRFPNALDLRDVEKISSFAEFDERFTAPIHGFVSAEEYWRLNSSRPFIPFIRIPTLIVNALNDPFLSEACFPIQEAEQSLYVWLEMPLSGGHVGFFSFDKTYWTERRALEWVASKLATGTARD
jgi:predicted alpha/beta-fold hydrolase